MTGTSGEVERRGENTAAAPAELRALEAAAAVMREHGIDISLPWEGDLDDLEWERFTALHLGCRAYAQALARHHESDYPTGGE